MNGLRYAALAATLLALAGCKDINEGMNLLEGNAPDATPAALAAFDVAPASSSSEQTGSPELEYLPQRGYGEHGEVYATGWNCTAIPNVRICV